MLAANSSARGRSNAADRNRQPRRPSRSSRQAGLDPMGNALVELESQFPFNLAHAAVGRRRPATAQGPLFGIGRTLYFCIPPNDKLLGYWDTVADRLFKIRHCMDIEGVVRPLPLFDPPIDPGHAGQGRGARGSTSAASSAV